MLKACLGLKFNDEVFRTCRLRPIGADHGYRRTTGVADSKLIKPLERVKSVGRGVMLKNAMQLIRRNGEDLLFAQKFGVLNDVMFRVETGFYLSRRDGDRVEEFKGMQWGIDEFDAESETSNRDMKACLFQEFSFQGLVDGYTKINTAARWRPETQWMELGMLDHQ